MSNSINETMDLTWTDRPGTDGSAGSPVPGLVLVVLGGQPRFVTIPLAADGTVTVGRGMEWGGVKLDDAWISRRHAQIARHAGLWRITDVGSRNGSAVDGEILQGGTIESASPRIVRLGSSLFLPLDDIRPFRNAPPAAHGDTVMGPTLLEVWGQISQAARLGHTLHITGESGAGKELAARAFHDLGPQASGPFIAVNCAAIPEGVAERLLFGARKGAFSGADAHADGYVQAAHKGTLFLDEVAELDLSVQAKLLRVLESREVMALGASRPTAVNLHIVSATHRDLRTEVARKRLREDLYFRLSRPHVSIPPLRNRLSVIPILVHRTVSRVGRTSEVDQGLAAPLTAHVSLIEACMLRHWPGNVRELIAEVTAAVQMAAMQGQREVEARHLPEAAGRAFDLDAGPTPADPPRAIQPAPRRAKRPPREVVEEALRTEEGNVSAAARRLGTHRTQLRRWMERYGLEAEGFRPEE